MQTQEESKKLSPPLICDSCNSANIQFIKNDVLYKKLLGNWPYVYHCKDCNALIGCHPYTNIPLGLMADQKTRALRKKAHLAFDPIWRNCLMSRTNAYSWLAEQLQISPDACHISWLTPSQLKTAISICSAYFAINQVKAAKRKVKKNEQRARQRKFEHTRIKLRKG